MFLPLPTKNIVVLAFALCGWYSISPAYAQERPDLREISFLFSVYKQADQLLANKRYSDAIQILGHTAGGKLSPPWKHLVLLKIGQIYKKEMRDEDKAMEIFRDLASLKPGPFQDKIGISVSQAIKNHAVKRIGQYELRKIKEALKKFYIEKVAYPAGLLELVFAGYIKEKDLVIDGEGLIYAYQVLPSNLFQQIERQNYQLVDINFEMHRLELDGILQGNPVIASIRSKGREGRIILVSEGAMIEGLKVCIILSEGIILCGKEEVIVLYK